MEDEYTPTPEDIESAVRILSTRKLDSERVRPIVEKTLSCDNEIMSFCPSIFEAVQYMPPDQALALFETRDLGDLADREELTGILYSTETPLYTLDELQGQLEACIQAQRAAKQELIAKGYVRKKTEMGRWIRLLLGSLYLTELPWEEPNNEIPMPDEDKEFIWTRRSVIYSLKISVLEEAIRALRSRNADGLLERCMEIISGSLSDEEVRRFVRLDQWYPEISPSGMTMGLPAGGIGCMLCLVGHVEREITLGTFQALRKAAARMFEVKPPDGHYDPGVYYWFTGTGLEHLVDTALELYIEYAEKDQQHWASFEERVASLAGSKFQSQLALRVPSQAKAHLEKLVELTLTELNTHGRLPELPHVNYAAGDPALPSSNTFRKDGDKWTLSYSGRTVYMDDRVGYHYIAELLSRPGEAVNVLQLNLIKTSGPKAQGDIYDGELDWDDRENFVIDGATYNNPRMDAAALANFRREYQAAYAELRRAKHSDNRPALESAERKLDILRQVAAMSFAKNGTSRQMDEATEGVRKRIGKSMTESLEPLIAEHPTLYAHLINSIKRRTGRNPRYLPETNIDWDL